MGTMNIGEIRKPLIKLLPEEPPIPEPIKTTTVPVEVQETHEHDKGSLDITESTDTSELAGGVSSVTDLDGKTHPMCGCFPFKAQMHPKLKALGYRQVQLTEDTLLGRRGETLKGHEFHYSNLALDESTPTIETSYTVASRKGGRPKEEGHLVRNTLGSYVHLHFGSRPECAAAFVQMCNDYQKKRS